MKRYLYMCGALLVVLVSGLVLSACGNKALKLESDLKEQMIASEAYFVESVYSKNGQTDFNTNTSQNFIADEKIYVKVATKVDEDIKKLQIGETLYSKGVDVSVLVNASSSVTRFAYKITDKTLYVSSLLMFLNMNTNGKVEITFPDNKIDKIVVDYFEANNGLKVELKLRQTDTLVEVNKSKLEYKFKVNNPNGEAFVVLNNGPDNVINSAPVLMLIVANPSKANQSSAYKFENPTKPTGEDKNGVLIFPGHNGGQAYTATTPANHKLIYNIYIPEIGVAKITINFENTFTA